MKTTIFIRILLATLLPLILVFGLVINTINNIIYERGASFAEESISSEARHFSDKITDRLNSAETNLNMFALLPDGMPLPSEESEHRMALLVDRLANMSPYILGAWGDFQAGSFRPSERFRLSAMNREEHLESMASAETDNAAARQTLYTRTLLGNTTQVLPLAPNPAGVGQTSLSSRIAMSVPVHIDGKTVGALGLEICIAGTCSQETATSRFANQWAIMVLSADGKVIYAPDALRVGTSVLQGPEDPYRQALSDALQDGKSLRFEDTASMEGEPSLVCLEPIRTKDADTGLFLFLSIPLESIHATTLSAMQLIVSTSILGLLLLVFSIFVATRNIVRPIKALTFNFNKIANGDLDIDAENNSDSIKPSGVREINILRKSLQKMLKQIHQAHEMRLKATEERVEKERIIAASQAKNQFFASMSHEIRTPMNAIVGIAEILIHDNHLNKQEKKYVKDIKITSEALLTIINDILDVSKIESGKLTLIEDHFNFTRFLANIQSIGVYLAEPNKLAFHFKEAANLPHCLFGDEIRLRQILLNLLSNACKFTREGSVFFTVSVEKDMLRFVIADTGVGIKKENLPGLFSPFSQMDLTKNRSIQGTGLGLSICKSLVELMRGSIQVTSEYGKGSVFTVTVPIVLGDASQLPQEEERPHRASYAPTLKVLIVDDNMLNLTVAEGLLQELYDIRCDMASSGREALEKLRDKEYHMVFMDHMMPDMDGIETTRRIRKMGEKYAKLPVIALTANAIEGAKDMMLNAGINDYLSKPIQMDELDAILAKWVPGDQKIPADH